MFFFYLNFGYEKPALGLMSYWVTIIFLMRNERSGGGTLLAAANLRYVCVLRAIIPLDPFCHPSRAWLWMQAPEGGKWVTDVTLPMNRELARRNTGSTQI